MSIRPGQYQADAFSIALGHKGYHKRTPQWGARAWKISGKLFDVIYWDDGNYWCTLVAILPRTDEKGRLLAGNERTFIAAVKKFYKDAENVMKESGEDGWVDEDEES